MKRVAILVVATTASALTVAIGGGLAASAPAGAIPPIPVTFSSQPGHADLVTHYTVTSDQRASKGQGVATDTGLSSDQLPDLSPKNFNNPHANALAGRNTKVSPSFASSGGSTPPLVSSFIGQQGSNITCSYFAHGCNPPDMAIAASPAFVLQGVNTQWEVASTNGTVLPGWPVSAQKFFGVPNQPGCDPGSGNQPFMSDPRAIYDASDKRYWAAMLQVEGALGIAGSCPLKTVYYIAVSQDSNPNGTWNVYEFDMSMGASFAADYTQIGLNHDALFFSANMFGVGPSSGQFYAETFEANKSQMEHGQAGFTADGFFNLQGNGPGIPIANIGPFLADTVQPMNVIGPDGGTGASHDGLFVDTVDGPDLVNGHLCTSSSDACHGLILWRMSNPIAHDSGGPAPTFTGTYLPNTVNFWVGPHADQPSCTACIDSNDLRIPGTPVLRNGVIYTGWDTGLNNGTQDVPAIVWARILPGNGSGTPTTTTGYFDLPGDQAATYPAFMPDGLGNVVMLYEHMSSTVYPEAKYTVLNNGASSFRDSGRVLKAGEASYRAASCGITANPCRWGDYEAMSYDGTSRIWLSGEYANSHTAPAVAPWFGVNWGTWMGSIQATIRGV